MTSERRKRRMRLFLLSHWRDFVRKKSVVVECGFTGGFQEKGVLDVVFLWSECDVMHGKRGHWNDVFRAAKIMQEFGNYFAGGLGGVAERGVVHPPRCEFC